jgi:RNA polymerase sigma-70 factor (ECF subfamily)
MSAAALCFPCARAWAEPPGREGRYLPRARMTPDAGTGPPDERSRADAELLRRIAAGDRAALGEIYDRFSRPLYSTALHIVRDAAEAQDIVHDVFIALWNKAGVFDHERGTAFSWAVTLTRNRSIDRLRTRRRRAGLLEQSLPGDLGYGEAAGGPAADAEAARGDESRLVRAALATLPAEQQRAVELAFFSGLTQQEIAARLQEPLGTIKARIRRGLVKLRETLAHRL